MAKNNQKFVVAPKEGDPVQTVGGNVKVPGAVRTQKKITASGEDNTIYLNSMIDILNLPKINMNDPEQVQMRINEYFGIYAKYGIKPTVSGLALCMNGMDRRRLWEIVNGKGNQFGDMPFNLCKGSSDILKSAYHSLELMWESYMLNGKINPVTGIFLAKNNFGYKDTTETVISPRYEEEAPSVDDIKSKYLDYSDD